MLICDQSLTAFAEMWFLVSTMLVVLTPHNTPQMCIIYWRLIDLLADTCMHWAGQVLINQVLKLSIMATASFAKAPTVSVEMMSTTTRMFLCQFTNYISKYM